MQKHVTSREKNGLEMGAQSTTRGQRRTRVGVCLSGITSEALGESRAPCRARLSAVRLIFLMGDKKGEEMKKIEEIKRNKRKTWQRKSDPQGNVAPNEGLCIWDKEDLEPSFDGTRSRQPRPPTGGWDNHFKVRSFWWLSPPILGQTFTMLCCLLRISQLSPN